MLIKKYVQVDSEGQIDIAQFSSWLDVSKVEFYSLEEDKSNKVIRLTFFDKDKNQIPANSSFETKSEAFDQTTTQVSKKKKSIKKHALK